MACAVIALSLALFLITKDVPFLYDDHVQIVFNDHIKHGLDLGQILGDTERPTRIIQNVSFALNWSWSQDQTWSYHLLNALTHGAASFLFFLVLLRLQVSTVVSAACSLLFLVHPLNIEAVTYIMGRNDLFRTLSTLTLLYLYLDQRRRPWVIWAVLSLSLLIKETCALTVVLLIGVDWILQGKAWREWRWREHLLYLTHVLWLPLIAHFFSYKTTHGQYVGFHLFPPVDYIVSNFYYLAFNLYLFFNPGSQSIYHDWIGHPPLSAVLVGVALFLALSWSALARWPRRWPLGSYMALFFLVSYLPTGSILQFVNPFAEYRLHQSNLALCYFITAGWLSLTIPQNLKLSVAVIFMSYCCAFTYLYNGVWESRLSIWSHALELYPEAKMANIAVAQVHFKNGQCALAEPHLAKACEEYPIVSQRANCLFSLALIYLHQAQTEKAQAQYEKLLALPPELRNKLYYQNLLMLSKNLKQTAELNRLLAEAQQKFPSDFKDWKFGLPPASAGCRD